MAAPFHGVARIDRDVEDRIVQLVEIGIGGPQIRPDIGRHFDILAERPAQKIRH